MLLIEHVGTPEASVEPSQRYEPLPGASSQQPKQSQPFGVSEPQNPRHGALWVCLACSQVTTPLFVNTCVLGLYSHVCLPLGL
jgi:hypothetical protein